MCLACLGAALEGRDVGSRGEAIWLPIIVRVKAAAWLLFLLSKMLVTIWLVIFVWNIYVQTELGVSLAHWVPNLTIQSICCVCQKASLLKSIKCLSKHSLINAKALSTETLPPRVAPAACARRLLAPLLSPGAGKCCFLLLTCFSWEHTGNPCPSKFH